MSSRIETTTSYRIEKDVMVPMRDGQTLATDLWVPDGGPVPTLLVRTPYGKAAVTTSDYNGAPWYSEGGAFSLHMSLWWSTLMSFFGAQRSMTTGTGGVDAVMDLAGALGDLKPRLAAMLCSSRSRHLLVTG